MKYWNNFGEWWVVSGKRWKVKGERLTRAPNHTRFYELPTFLILHLTTISWYSDFSYPSGYEPWPELLLLLPLLLFSPFSYEPWATNHEPNCYCTATATFFSLRLWTMSHEPWAQLPLLLPLSYLTSAHISYLISHICTSYTNNPRLNREYY